MTFLEILAAQVKEKGMLRVSKEIRYSKATISLVLNGKYPGPTKYVEAAVLERYTRVDCPFLGRNLSGDECAAFSGRACPSSDPAGIRHWAACQGCPHKKSPAAKKEKPRAAQIA